MTKIRVVSFSVLLLVPFGVLEARVFWMQVLNAEEYRSRADWVRTWVEVVPTPRGAILDRNGDVLAREERCFDLDVVPAEFEMPRQKGRDPELDYDRMARMLHELLRLLGAPEGLDAPACARMLRSRVLPTKALPNLDGGRPATGPDTDAMAAMLRPAGSPARTEAGQLYLKAVKALRQADAAAQRRCGVPGKPVSVRDRRTIIRQEWRQPFRLWAGLSYDQAAEVAIDEARFPGLEIRQRTKRVYPRERVACQAIGHVGLMGASEYERLERGGCFRLEMGLDLTEENRKYRKEAEEAAARENRRVRWPDRFNESLRGRITDAEYERLEFRGAFFDGWVGRSGVEGWSNDELCGRRGIERRAKHLLSKKEWVEERVEPVAGRDIRLTVDARLQTSAETLLDTLPLGLRGSIVVLDARNGEILALASAPGYDANWLLPPVGKEEWKLLSDPDSAPTFNRAISGLYPLGSIFKSVTGVAGLESGKISPEDRVTCQGRFDPVQWPNKFACWIAAHGGVHGDLCLREALARSCNCFFFEAGRRAGIDDIAAMADRFGLGRRSGVDLPYESAGRVPTPAWRRATGGGRWGFADTLNVSIGQGDILVSPLQAARLMAGLATGRLPVPRMRLDEPARWEELALRPETLCAIREGLEAVTMEGFGTAHASGLHLFNAAGKTSTAQSSSRERGLEHHGWFAGYAPADDPEIAFCVMIEHGGAGSGLPAKTATRLLSAMWPDVKVPEEFLAPAVPVAHDDAGRAPVPMGPVFEPEAEPPAPEER